MPNFKAVIFDMDGVLVDSMIHWLVADTNFFKGYGVELTDDMVKYFSGRSEKENMCWAKEKFNMPDTVEELLEKRRLLTDKIYSYQSVLMPGVVELLEKIKKAGVKQAVGSGAPSGQVDLAAKRFSWSDYFRHLVASDHVGHKGKPDPAIFLHAAKLLEVEPEHCVVIEDAENGVTAAKAAGMSCVAVTDPRWSFGNFSHADLVVNSLKDLKVYKFLGLV